MLFVYLMMEVSRSTAPYFYLNYIFLFLVLASISSDEEENVTEEYAHQQPVEEATTQLDDMHFTMENKLEA